MSEFRRMILKVSSITNDVATIPTTNDHQDGSWLDTDIYIGELFLNVADNILQTRTDTGIVEVSDGTSGGGSWGSITGTLSNQTDLQNALDTKQIELVSGTNIKTINGNTLLGSGNLAISSAWGSITGTLSSQTDLATALDDTTLIPTLTIGVDRTLVLTDRDTNIENDNDISITIPLNSSVAFPLGTQIFFTKKYESMAFAVAGGVTLNSVDDFVNMGRVNSGAELLKINTDTWNLKGELIAMPIIPFTFSVNTANAGTGNTQFKLPLAYGTSPNFDVAWGDGTNDTITTWNQAEATHTYPNTGTYTIEITNDVTDFKFNYGGDRAKILDISKWGKFIFNNERVFTGCSNLTCSATDTPTISTLDMSYTFYGCTVFNSNLNSWDMSGVLNTSNLFTYADAFDSDISSWDVSSVEDASGMFYSAISFNQDIGSWNVGNVTTMSSMLYKTTAFDKDISSWDINQVSSLSNFLALGNLSTANYDALLIGWEAQAPTSGLTPNFGSSQYTLGGASATARASLISTYGWTITDGGGIAPPVAFTFSVNTANAGSASNQFQLPLVSSGTISMDVDWGDGTTDTITSYNQAETLHTYVSSGIYTIAITNEVRGWKFNNGGDKLKMLDISQWNEFNFTKGFTFYGCSNLTCSATDIPTIESSDSLFMFRMCTSFNGDISGWDITSITSMYGMFNTATSFDQNLGVWNMSSVTNLGDFLTNVTLSTTNYDALLIGWASQSLQSGVSPNFGSSKYTLGGAAATARASLISTYGWTITDGGGI